MLVIRGYRDGQRQSVGAIKLEHVRGIHIEDVVRTIDVQVRIVEIITQRFVCSAIPKDSGLFLNRESGEQLEFTGETFCGGEFDAVVGICIERRDVGDEVVGDAHERRVKAIQCERLIGDWIDDRRPVERRNCRVVRRRGCQVQIADQVALVTVVVSSAMSAEVMPQFLFVGGIDFVGIGTAEIRINVRDDAAAPADWSRAEKSRGDAVGVSGAIPVVVVTVANPSGLIASTSCVPSIK